MIDPGNGFVIGGTHHGATLSSAGRSPGDTRKLRSAERSPDSYTAHVYPTENVELETYQLHIFRSSDTTTTSYGCQCRSLTRWGSS